jgi:hypothetical protein
MKERKFVFVVVGEKDHIIEMNQSIKTLKNFSAKEIFVVTDLSRNKAIVEHENVIDVKTPEHYSNHQAAIFLKTGLHHFLNMSHDYCYLDGDVLVVNEHADNVFSHFVAPVTFCTDHCRLQYFSEAAVPSMFNHEIIRKQEILKSLFDTSNKFKSKREPLLKTFIVRLIGYFFFRIAILRNGFFYDKRNYRWTDFWGNIILFEKSDNLVNEIRKKFDVDVIDKKWKHWNGGVFLFNSESVEFLEKWHQWTQAIFDDKNWQVRDQGTLIATAWKFGLENHPTLPLEFNFLADYHHPTMKYYGDLTFGFNNTSKVIKPVFLHIYHHWGDKEWLVWNDVERIVLSKI